MLDAELCLGRRSIQPAHTLRLQPQLIVALVLCLTHNDTSAVASSSLSFDHEMLGVRRRRVPHVVGCFDAGTPSCEDAPKSSKLLSPRMKDATEERRDPKRSTLGLVADAKILSSGKAP